MKTLSLFAIMCFTSILATTTHAQTDLFWSLQGFGEGAVNTDLEIDAEVGDIISVFAYWDTFNTEIDTGIKFAIETAEPGIIDFVGGETFDFDITIQGTSFIVGQRWGTGFGPLEITNENQLAFLTAFTVSDSGVSDENTGPVFLDEGYDPLTDAFLYGRVDIEVVGEGTVQFSHLLVNNGNGIVNNGMTVEASFGTVTVNATSKNDILLGDLNGDGMVTLLDINLFVELLVNGEFQLEGDMNQDGNVDLLDVDLIVDAILFP